MTKIVKNSNAEYHSGDGLSKSDLDLIHICPEKYRHKKDNPDEEKTPALIFGSMVHKLILEPAEFNSEYAVIPVCDRRTKEGKELYSEFLAVKGEREAVSCEDYEKALDMAKAVQANPKAFALLSGGEAEKSYYWTDERTGILCKCRPDKVNKGYIIDLKTTEDASPEAFSRALNTYRYHVQAAWYLRGYEAATGVKPEGFVFIAVEKKPPYSTAVYICNDIAVDIGTREADSDLDVFVSCQSSGNWYGYGGEKNEVMSIDLPQWKLKEYGV